MAESAKRITSGGLHIDQRLYALVAEQIAPGTDVDVDHFWAALGKIVEDLGPKNQQLLQRRDALQAQIDAYHQQRRGEPLDSTDYRAFLEEIGYLLPTGDAHQIRTENTDPEIASLAGPQLVVPVDNARYALNAANARWGSLYDALYGTDVIEGRVPTGEYDAERGAQVIARSEAFLDAVAGLQQGAYREVVEFFFLRERRRRANLVRSPRKRRRSRPQRRRAVRRLWMRGRAAKQRLAPPQRIAHRNPNRPHPSHWAHPSRRRQRRALRSGHYHHPRLRGFRGCG